MVDLGMKLHPVEPARRVLNGCHRRVVGFRHHLESPWNALHVVPVAHPDRTLFFEEKTFEQRTWPSLGMELGMAELPLACRNDPPAEVAAHELHAVADSQNRHAEFKEFLGDGRSTLLVDRLGAAGKDDTPGSEVPDSLQVHVEGMQFAVDMCLPHPPGNELGVLGAEVENEDFFAVYVVHLLLREE